MIRSMALTLGALIAASPAAAQNPAASPDRAFANVHVIPLTGDTVLRDRTVVVRDGRIERVVPSAGWTAPSDVEVVDGGGRYLMPGLADMHGHIWDDREIVQYLAAGVTLVRNMAGSPFQLDRRRRIAAGEMLGPEIHTTGPIMAGGSYGPWSDPDSAYAAVLAQAEAGYDFVKVYEQLPADVYRAIARAADDAGIPMVGHISSEVGVAEALRLGQRTIDHVYPFTWEVSRDPKVGVPGFAEVVDAWLDVDRDRMRSWAERAAGAGVAVVPTSRSLLEDFGPSDYVIESRSRPGWAWTDPVTRVQRIEDLPRRYSAARDEEFYRRVFLGDATRDTMIRFLHEAGVPILAGTDHPPHGSTLHDEIIELERIGLSAYEALAAATIRPAEALGIEGERGTIEPGRRAELLLLERNPLDDIRNVRTVAGVMTGGVWLDADTLRWMLDQLRSGVYIGDPTVPGSGRRVADGVLPRLDPRGRWVYYVDMDPRRSAVVPLPPGDGAGPPLALLASIMRVPVEGGVPRVVAGGVAIARTSSNTLDHSYDLSPDARRVAFVTFESGGDGFNRPAVAIASLADAVSPEPSVRARLVHTTRGAHGTPRWAPDGSAVAFLDGDALILIDPATGHARTLATIGGAGREVRWSPDSRLLAVPGAPAGSGDEPTSIVLVSVEGEVRRLGDPGDPRIRRDIRWHPSGRALTYVARGDEWTLERIPVEGGPASPILGGPGWWGTMFEWSPDGTRLFYRVWGDGTPLFSLDMTTDGAAPVAFAPHGFSPPHVTAGLVAWSQAADASRILAR